VVGRLAIRGQVEQAPGLDGLALPLDRERLDFLRADQSADQAVGRVAEQDLARRRALLQARRHVDRVAAGEALAAARIPRHDLAGVDADPHRDRGVLVTLEQLVETCESHAHLGRGADGPQNVVLVRLRHAEYRHDRIADELLDDPSVALDDGAHRVEVAREHGLGRLRVDPLGQRRRLAHVGEDHRDRLANPTLGNSVHTHSPPTLLGDRALPMPERLPLCCGAYRAPGLSLFLGHVRLQAKRRHSGALLRERLIGAERVRHVFRHLGIGDVPVVPLHDPLPLQQERNALGVQRDALEAR
jgi:hypothetical protein